MNKSDAQSIGATERFTGLARKYAQHRPNYPDSAIDFIVNWCKLKEGSTLVDVGAGTGISSRQFAERRLSVIGIEPNDEMRQVAKSEKDPESGFVPKYESGTAEATGIADGSAHAVVAAQAFHWFDRDAALVEFVRILRPSGWVALMWNERDEADLFTRKYGDVVRSSDEAFRSERLRFESQVTLGENRRLPVVESFHFPNEQVLSEEELIGRAFSSSYAPRTDPMAIIWEGGLRSAFREFADEGRVSLKYTTYVHLLRKSV